MFVVPPLHPDVRRQLKARLLDLSPRAFELFAGDLLVYIGLQNIAVTRYTGDGGIDAHGDLVAVSGLACVPTGVQVKRHRRNIGRPDIDRFIGALAGAYRHGIFITTSQYADQARAKAISSPVIRVDAIDGDQIVALMLRHKLGFAESANATPRIDESYFVIFEVQASTATIMREEQQPYETGTDEIVGSAVPPENDLISLRALSYALRVDTTTIRNWIEGGKLIADSQPANNERDGFFFRRDRVEAIRREFVRVGRPGTSAEWRQEFLDFASSRNLTKSYKPVFLKALLRMVDRNGTVAIDDLVREFHAFYLQRQQDGKPTEFGVPLLNDATTASHEAIKQLVVRNPLDRFIIKGFLEYTPSDGTVRFSPVLWSELRFYELLDVQNSADEQLRYYYERGSQA